MIVGVKISIENPSRRTERISRNLPEPVMADEPIGKYLPYPGHIQLFFEHHQPVNHHQVGGVFHPEPGRIDRSHLLAGLEGGKRMVFYGCISTMNQSVNQYVFAVNVVSGQSFRP
jgi:hypothetical protein